MEQDQQQRNLTERESAVLGALVFEYIATGKPVGSRSFVQKYSFNISPATMRNIMFDLEALNYLAQPHTSAGRVPTDKGYRYYVDRLLGSYELKQADFSGIKSDVLTREIELNKMFASVTRMLSDISKYAGIILTPKPDFTVVKHVELVPLGQGNMLFILVTRTGIVLNKRVSVSQVLNQDELHRFSKYLTSELNGYSIFAIKDSVLNELRAKLNPNNEMQLAIDIVELALVEDESQDLYIEGIENILKIPEMIDEALLLPFLHLIEDRKNLIFILKRNMRSDGVSTLIGEEIDEGSINGCSLVTTAYKIGNNHVGVVGIIGPTRMNYKTVVPLVDYTGKVVSELLTKMSK
ncbi:MAG: heat-inducible transcriptional repressor HrcA [Spirochaetes bacterium]|jgi:heat-inducible transcriptional repressor|nr:heat-inducible transcriptional repressor HrcA [Spirochaetota bacterium]